MRARLPGSWPGARGACVPVERVAGGPAHLPACAWGREIAGEATGRPEERGFRARRAAHRQAVMAGG